MSTLTDFTFPSSNGKVNIHVRRHLPDGEVKATVQIAHGIAEYAARYDAFASFLADNGFAVYANDHMGHGKSISEDWPISYFGDEKGWDMAIADMKKLHEIVINENPGVPCYLFGHSMGSFLSRTYIILHPNDFNAAVLSGTGQQSKALIIAGKMMAKMEITRHGPAYQSDMLNKLAFGSYNNGYTSPRTSHDWLSRDTGCVDKYVADPLCGFVPSAGLFHQMMCGIDFISNNANLKKMNPELPVYFMSGDADPVGENGKGVKKAYANFIKAGMKDVSIRLYKGGRHEMLNELNKDDVYKDVLCCLEDWLKQ